MEDDKKNQTKNKENTRENSKEQYEEGKVEEGKEKADKVEDGSVKSTEEKDRSKELLDEQVIIPGGEVTVRADGKSGWDEAYKWLSEIGSIDRETLVRERKFLDNRIKMIGEETDFIKKRLKRSIIKLDEMIKEDPGEYGNAGKYNLDSNPPGMTQA